jgi:hypothetical protein
MAVPVVNFTSAETDDAAPTAAPYRISRLAAKDDLDFTWEITFDATVRYWQERLGGSLRTNGTKVRRHLGAVCGLGNRCGAAGTMPLAIDVADSPYAEGDTYNDMDADMASAGTYRFGVDALNDSGWSALT